MHKSLNHEICFSCLNYVIYFLCVNCKIYFSSLNQEIYFVRLFLRFEEWDIFISGFTCLYKFIFLIICNLSSFSVRNWAALLSKKKLICQILTSKLKPSLVCHGLIRALLSLAASCLNHELYFSCLEKLLNLLHFPLLLESMGIIQANVFFQEYL